MAEAWGGKRQQSIPLDKNIHVISIIIVTRNAQSYLQSCLNSIIGQRFQNLQVLILDGASTDNTIELLRQNNHYITYWKSEPDEGIYYAMNKALEHANGDWFYFLGADDIILETFSDFAERLVKKNTVYYGDCLTDKSHKLDGAFSAYRLTKMNICHHSVFYPAAVFAKYKYPTQFPVFADYALNLQCWGDTNFPKKYLPILIAKFHTEGFSLTAQDEGFKKIKKEWIKKYMSTYAYTRYLIKKFKEKRNKKSNFF